MKIIIEKLIDMSPLSVFEMFKLRVDVFVVEQNCPYPEIDELDKECIHLQIKDGDILAAYCRIITEGETARIGRVIVNPAFRGKQLGRHLMTAAIEDIERTEQYNCIELSAQSHLQHFYSSFGFKVTSEEYLEDDIPHIDMKLAIK